MWKGGFKVIVGPLQSQPLLDSSSMDCLSAAAYELPVSGNGPSLNSSNC
jgi:hypothetical protein